MISITSSGDYKKTTDFLKGLTDPKGNSYPNLDHYGRVGVEALSRATPVESSLTANSWKYRIIRDRNGFGIEWYNTNVAGTTPVAILIQYGHATGTGGYVVGRDYINPGIRPVFDQIVNEFWKKVKL